MLQSAAASLFLRPLSDATLLAMSAALTPYAFVVTSLIRPGHLRFLALAPFFPPLLLLPRAFPSSPLLRSAQSSCWLTLLNLLLLSFSSSSSAAATASSFPFFAASLLLPYRVKRSSSSAASPHLLPILLYALPLSTVILFSPAFPPFLIRPICLLLTYVSLSFAHHLFSIVFHVFFRSALLPVFDRPWLATSINDFWSSRWNLDAHELLRQAIYLPILRLSWHADGKPPLSVRIPAVIITFLVSGIFHEIAYYGMTQAESLSWEVTAFFLIQGLAASLEIFLRRTHPGHGLCRLPHTTRVFLTLSFVTVTAIWLMYAELDRSTPFIVECGAEIRSHLSAMAAVLSDT